MLLGAKLALVVWGCAVKIFLLLCCMCAPSRVRSQSWVLAGSQVSLSPLMGERKKRNMYVWVTANSATEGGCQCEFVFGLDGTESHILFNISTQQQQFTGVVHLQSVPENKPK